MTCILPGDRPSSGGGGREITLPLGLINYTVGSSLISDLVQTLFLKHTYYLRPRPALHRKLVT